MLSRHCGFSLTELLVAFGISLSLITAGLAFYSSFAEQLTRLQVTLSLRQETRFLLSVMERELSRAGYGLVTDLPISASSPFQQQWAISERAGEQASSCILFGYDVNQNQVFDETSPAEGRGFRLYKGALEYRMDNLTCADGRWQDASDTSLLSITTLTFIPGALAGTLAITLTTRATTFPDITMTVHHMVHLHNA